ncbi:MAG: dehydrogenase E1 component subunit alpha/beta [Vicinamibacterales bacterium]
MTMSASPRATIATSDARGVHGHHQSRSWPVLPGIERDEFGKPRLPLELPVLYTFGTLIRRTEQLLLNLFAEGLVSGTTHTCLGQELCQMAVGRALTNPDDVLLSNHRNHGHFLTYSGDFLGLVAEVMGRESGVCRGIGGSQHIACRNFHSNGVQGGMTAIGVGHAMASKWRDSGGIVACVVGDGTLGEGLFYESLNLASTWRVPILFVVEQNGIAQTTRTADTIAGSIAARGLAFDLPTWQCDDAAPAFLEAVEETVRSVRMTRTSGLLVIETRRLGPHSKGDDLRSGDEMCGIRERDPLTRLGLCLDTALRESIDGRCEEFVKGVRDEAMSSRPASFERTPREIFVVDRPVRTMRGESRGSARRSVRASLTFSLDELLREHPEVVLLGEDLHDPYGGAFKVTSGLSSRYPGRVISTPISEAGLVGAAIGLSLAGYRTVAEIMFADFLTLAMDQIANHAVKFPGMFDVKLPMVIRAASGGHRGYGPTHSQSPEGMMTAVPGLTVVAPSHRHDAGALLETALLDWEYPTVFLEHKILYSLDADPGPYEVLHADDEDTGASFFPTLVRRQDAPDMTIVATGGALPMAESVAEELASEELAVEIVAPALLQPFPRRTLTALLASRPAVAIVEESPLGPGFGSELAAALMEEGYRGRVRRFAPPPVPIPAARSLESAVLFDDRSLLAAITAFAEEQ